MSATTQRPFDEELAAAAAAPGPPAGPLNGAKAMLFTGQPSLSKTTVLADLTPATFTGYVEKPLVWSAPVLDANNRICLFANEVTWTPTDNVNSNEISGYGVVNAAGDKLLFAEMLPGLVGMVDSLSFLGLTIQWVSDNANPGTVSVVT